jgi:hypothetical protein
MSTPSIAQSLSTAVGFGMAAGQDRYVRLDIIGGTFLKAVSAADLDIAVDGETITLVQGGAIGQSSAIFQVTAAGFGGGIPASAMLTWQLADQAIGVSGTTASLRYSLYSTAADSVSERHRGNSGRRSAHRNNRQRFDQWT